LRLYRVESLLNETTHLLVAAADVLDDATLRQWARPSEIDSFAQPFDLLVRAKLVRSRLDEL